MMPSKSPWTKLLLSTSLVMAEMERMGRKNLEICFLAQGLNTIIDGKPDATVKAMVSMFGAFAELERSTIVDRLQSGRRVTTERGGRMGRKVGYHLSDKEVLAKYPKVVRKLKEGFSVRETAKVCGVSVWTVQKVKGILEATR